MTEKKTPVSDPYALLYVPEVIANTLDAQVRSKRGCLEKINLKYSKKKAGSNFGQFFSLKSNVCYEHNLFWHTSP